MCTSVLKTLIFMVLFSLLLLFSSVVVQYVGQPNPSLFLLAAMSATGGRLYTMWITLSLNLRTVVAIFLSIS